MGHTPGPWAVRPWGDNDYEINAALDTVCNVPGFDDDTVDVDRAEANANLIAAAPDLLTALQEAVTALNVKEKFPVYDTDSYAIAARCDKAIAKAEGRSE